MLWLRGLDSTPHLSSCLVSHYGIRCILLRWVFSSWKEAAAVTCPELDYSSVDTLGATGVKTLFLMFISACVVLLICQCFSTFHEENKSHPWVSKCTRGSKRRLSFFGSFWRAVTRLSCFVGAKQNGAVREQGIQWNEVRLWLWLARILDECPSATLRRCRVTSFIQFVICKPRRQSVPQVTNNVFELQDADGHRNLHQKRL